MFFFSDDRARIRRIENLLHIILNHTQNLTMTTAEAFDQIAKDNEQLKKGLGEVRAKIDAQTALIQQLQSTTLTPEQEALVADLSAQTQALDDIVPDAPPVP